MDSRREMQQEMQLLAEHAGQAAALLKQLSNVNRLMILCTLVAGEMSVGELNAGIPLSQSALSQHLAGLREAELVATRREGQVIFYRLQNPAVVEVLQVLKRLFCPE